MIEKGIKKCSYRALLLAKNSLKKTYFSVKNKEN